jgi:hypothetical protein
LVNAVDATGVDARPAELAKGRSEPAGRLVVGTEREGGRSPLRPAPIEWSDDWEGATTGAVRTWASFVPGEPLAGWEAFASEPVLGGVAGVAALPAAGCRPDDRVWPGRGRGRVAVAGPVMALAAVGTVRTMPVVELMTVGRIPLMVLVTVGTAPLIAPMV